MLRDHLLKAGFGPEDCPQARDLSRTKKLEIYRLNCYD